MAWRLMVCGLCLMLGPQAGWAKDQTLTDDTVEVRTQDGHHLLLPKDWPVERKDGRFAPVSVEEYISMKFGQVREQFAAMARRLDGLDRRIGQLEQDSLAVQKRLRRLESVGDTATGR